MSETLAAVQERTFARAMEATAASYPSEHRLTGDQLAVYLDRREFAVVGSTRADGRPHAAMSSYFRRDGTFWLPTVGGSVRERNIRAQPWTTMVVTEGDHDHHIVVIIEGPTQIIAPADAPLEICQAMSSDWVGAWLRLRTERLLSYAASAALS